MTRVLDFRSDTVTRPDPDMRAAMAAAEVGDDGYHDDPTIRRLEERVAEMLGLESALFVPTGTLANQLAVRVLCRPGETIAAPPGCHLQVREGGNAAAMSGAQVMPIGTPHGYTAEDLQALVDEESCGWPRVGLCWLENTLGTPGGAIWPLASMEQVAKRARDLGRPIHLDGSRLWNAHVATGVPLETWAACADSTSVCLSKGLGAPVGSLLAGRADIVDRARQQRYGMGGTLRQAGILAAAALLALDRGFDHIAGDHHRARRLAGAIADLPMWDVDPPQTNVVLCRLTGGAPARPVCQRLTAAGVVCNPNRFREIRLVVHRDLDDGAIDEAAARIRDTLA